MLDPRKILRQLSPALLRELFRRHNQLHAADWPGQDDRPQETPSSHLIYEAWRRLPETARQQIHTVLRDVHELADHAGIKVIAETVRSHHPERAWEFSGWAIPFLATLGVVMGSSGTSESGCRPGRSTPKAGHCFNPKGDCAIVTADLK